MRIGAHDIEWRVEIRGSAAGGIRPGEPVLFLHGFSQDMRTWFPILERFPTDLTSVLVDLPGHGQSAKPRDPAPYRTDLLVQSLEVLRAELGYERWHVVGYSMGGRIALAYAASHPKRVASLVLESASFGPRDAAARTEAVRADEALVERLRGSSAREFAEWWATMPVLASQADLPADVRSIEAEMRAANDPQALACVVLGAGQGRMNDLSEAASMLPMPLMYVVGSKDPKYSAIAQDAHDMWGLDVRRLPTGHNVHLEQPQEYAALLLRFFRHEDEERR
jgi:2-succinyl-6-hydroxy-2,4-cyclohexadiene-1-carboxylate synthase